MIPSIHSDSGELDQLPAAAPYPVLFLHGGDGWLRGSENVLLTTLRGLDRSRITPTLFCGHEVLGQAARFAQVEAVVRRLPEIMADGRYFRFQIVRWAWTIGRLLSIIKRQQIRLIYCNGGSTCQFGYYAAQLAGIPVICQLHSPYHRRHVLLYRLHRAKRIIFVSRAIKETILAKQEFSGKCDVIHNGVDTAKFQPPVEGNVSWREKLGIQAQCIVFGQVSSLILRKGVDVLLRAFQLTCRRHTQARLVLVGDGPDRAEFEALSEELSMRDRVVFAGNQANPLPFYQHIMDVNVLASRSDAFPLSILEASSCGLSTIAADVGGIPESVLDGRTGLLFEPGNHRALAERMCLLIEDPASREAMGKAARQFMLDKFSEEAYCRSIQRIMLEEIVTSEGTSGSIAAQGNGAPTKSVKF